MKPWMALGKAAWQAAVRVSGKREGEERLREILDRARHEMEQL
jgi:hypothetical protein